MSDFLQAFCSIESVLYVCIYIEGALCGFGEAIQAHNCIFSRYYVVKLKTQSYLVVH